MRGLLTQLYSVGDEILDSGGPSTVDSGGSSTAHTGHTSVGNQLQFHVR